jgi:hypothetical protein
MNMSTSGQKASAPGNKPVNRAARGPKQAKRLRSRTELGFPSKERQKKGRLLAALWGDGV